MTSGCHVIATVATHPAIVYYMSTNCVVVVFRLALAVQNGFI